MEYVISLVIVFGFLIGMMLIFSLKPIKEFWDKHAKEIITVTWAIAMVGYCIVLVGWAIKEIFMK